MKIELKNLPTDHSVLHQIIIDLNTKLYTLTEENQFLREQLALLKAKRFGKSSEQLAKLDKQIEELELIIEENEITSPVQAETGDEEPGSGTSKIGAKRKALPDHLPRTEIIIPAPTNCPSCGGHEFRKIADDASEILEYVPSSFKVIRTIRPRCACVHCEQIVQGEAPGNTIDKGKAGPGLLAHILTSKYCDHLPIYRQSQMYEREGIEVARSTMTGWARQCALLIVPVIDELKKSIFSVDHIHGDDTPIKVLAPSLGKTKIGRLWTYVRDGRNYGDNIPPAVCYFYSPDRKGARPAEHLKDYNGVLHADAYSGYDKLYGENISEAACWAHVRRKFYEVTLISDNATIATNAVEEIGKIYDVERSIRGRDPNERLEVRMHSSKQLVENLFISFKKNYSKLPQKSATAKAIAYALNNEMALMRFLSDGKIEIDNNTAERAMRVIALGRKNWLFAGSDRGGETAAGIYSLIETAKLNNINPWQYLHSVLATIQDHNSTKMQDLLPWNIKLLP
jgi:transposase